MAPLAKPALDAYRDGRVRFVPERYGRTYEHWLENIRDWNVSRQIWWGHQLPVWYTNDGREVVAETEEEASRHRAATVPNHRPNPRSRYARHVVLERHLAVLDSRLAATKRRNSVLVSVASDGHGRRNHLSLGRPDGDDGTARDRSGTPFRDVVVTPLVFDSAGRKMSKSLGNAIDPMDLAERYGADAFRLSILRQMRLESQEIRYQESRCEEARNFNNKIWNATRYMLSLDEGLPAP